MSKTCQNCANIFDDNVNICPRCGMQYIAVEPSQPEQAGSGEFSYFPHEPQPQYEQQYQQPQYMPPQQPVAAEEKQMGVGSWLGTILLTTLLGPISLVLLFIWAFGSDVPTAKKNYCCAMLIWMAISTVLSICAMVLLMVYLVSTGAWDEIAQRIEELAAQLSQIEPLR